MAARIVPAEESMAEAVARLRAGGLVAFPTETVYGLGANALDADAVAGIFAAKGRPATNPLIVHVADVDAARGLSADWTPAAEALAARFWPGPLTLVVQKAATIPDIVTAGGTTVGLRVPDHSVALKLLRESGVPVAAPSANRSEEVSPTTAQHVADSLGAWVDDLLILDGGPTTVGIESTVVDVTGETPRLLRPGMVALPEWTTTEVCKSGQGVARSPGQTLRHYAPRTPVTLIPSGEITLRTSPNDGLLAIGTAPVVSRYVVRLPADPTHYAAMLYAVLRIMDERGLERILVELPPDKPEWNAIHDRLRRAAAPIPPAPFPTSRTSFQGRGSLKLMASSSEERTTELQAPPSLEGGTTGREGGRGDRDAKRQEAEELL